MDSERTMIQHEISFIEYAVSQYRDTVDSERFDNYIVNSKLALESGNYLNASENIYYIREMMTEINDRIEREIVMHDVFSHHISFLEFAFSQYDKENIEIEQLRMVLIDAKNRLERKQYGDVEQYINYIGHGLMVIQSKKQ